MPVDRLVTEAEVTRATFYRHFPAKEDLVEAYLRATDADLRAVRRRDSQPAGQPAAGRGRTARTDRPGHLLRGVPRLPLHQRCRRIPGPGGPDPRRRRDHRAWFQDTVTRLAAQLGHPDPAQAGQILVLLHDGAPAAAQLDEPGAVRRAVTNAALTPPASDPTRTQPRLDRGLMSGIPTRIDRQNHTAHWRRCRQGHRPQITLCPTPQRSRDAAVVRGVTAGHSAARRRRHAICRAVSGGSVPSGWCT